MYKQRILTGMTSLLFLGTLGLTGCSTGASTNNGASASSHSSANATHANDQHENEKSASVTLKSPSGATAGGMASMTLNTKFHELTVVAEVSGLKVGVKYVAKIENTVSHQTTYDLKTFTADKSGNGLLNMVIKNVKEIPSTGSRLGIYQASKMGTSPLLYGDIQKVSP